MGAAEDDVVLSVQLAVFALEFLEHLRGSRWSQKAIFHAQKLWRFVSALAKNPTIHLPPCSSLSA